MLTLLVALLSVLGFALASTQVHSNGEWATQLWLFDWDSAGVDPTVSLPQTAQCDTLNIKWSRASNDVPDYVPPFYLKIYTSVDPVPFLIPAGTGLSTNFTVPFAPGTQYQICMVDSVGNSGGCQASYTVYPNNTFTQDPKTKNVTIVPPTCANVTSPFGQINVTGVDVNGPLTRMAWADQCTDISVKPTNGTPPFILSIAPTYHPPMNITSNTMDAINWTVTLGWAHQFYMSLTDANGNSWMTGPLHSGGNGPTDCLVLGGNNLGLSASVGSQGGISSKVVIGSTIGAAVFGILVGLLASLCLNRKKQSKPTPEEGKEKDATALASTSRGSRFAVEPYPLPSQSEPQSPEVVGGNLSRSTSPNSTMHPGRSEMARQTSDGSSRQVYVVHHDGGRPNISVYHPEGANVVELPPSYGPRTPLEAQGGQSSLAQRMESPKGHKRREASGSQSQ